MDTTILTEWLREMTIPCIEWQSIDDLCQHYNHSGNGEAEVQDIAQVLKALGMEVAGLWTRAMYLPNHPAYVKGYESGYRKGGIDHQNGVVKLPRREDILKRLQEIQANQPEDEEFKLLPEDEDYGSMNAYPDDYESGRKRD